jgi:hypothetical protein
MKPEERFVIILGICFVLLSGVIIYALSKQETESNVYPNEYTISGVVIHRSNSRVWLLLTERDTTNNIETGTLMTYNLLNNTDIDFEVGDLLKGTLLDNDTLVCETRINFMNYDYSYGFVVKGDNLLYNGSQIKQDLSSPYPSLRFALYNLGEHEVIGIRVQINDELLPYSFGVSKQSPLAPSQSLYANSYIAWYDPAVGNVTGFTLNDGDEYSVEVTVKYKNLKSATFSSTGVFTLDRFGPINSLRGFDSLHMYDPDLFSRGVGEHGTLCFWFRNEWYVNGLKQIERVEATIDGQLVLGFDKMIAGGDYFAVYAEIPFDLVDGIVYDVSLIAYSSDGMISKYTLPVLCQYYRIK